MFLLGLQNEISQLENRRAETEREKFDMEAASTKKFHQLEAEVQARDVQIEAQQQQMEHTEQQYKVISMTTVK